MGLLSGIGNALGGIAKGVGGFIGGPWGKALGIGGSLIGGFGSKSPSVSSNSSMAPWAAKYMNPYFKALQKNYKNYSPQYFQGDAVANLNGMQTAGANGLYNFGARGFDFSPQSNALLNQTMAGDFLKPPSFLDNMYKTKLDEMGTNVASQFAANGRTGGAYNSDAFGRGSANVLDQVYGDNYRRERDMQNAAMGLSTQRDLANWQNDLQGYNAMLQAGGLFQDQAQREIDANKARWDWEQNLPYFKLNQYGAGLGLMNSAPTNTTQQAGNGFSQKLGNSLGMLGAANDIFGWFK